MSSIKPTIKVRTKDVIAIHWFNAFFWLTLVLTGFGIISGDFVRLAPAFWPTFLQNVLGGNANLVLLHGIGGMVWAGVIGVYALLNFKRVVLPFLKNVLVLTPKTAIADVSSMVITLAHLFGLLKHKSVPPQGRYNGAQRLLGTMIIACSLAIAVTVPCVIPVGITLISAAFSRRVTSSGNSGVARSMSVTGSLSNVSRTAPPTILTAPPSAVSAATMRRSPARLRHSAPGKTVTDATPPAFAAPD